MLARKQRPSPRITTSRAYDVTEAGGFLMIGRGGSEERPPTRIEVVVNRFQEVRPRFAGPLEPPSDR
jgi:hypothetical protein